MIPGIQAAESIRTGALGCHPGSAGDGHGA